MRKLEFARLLCRFDLSLFCPKSYITILNNLGNIPFTPNSSNAVKEKMPKGEKAKIEFLIVILFF